MNVKGIIFAIGMILIAYIQGYSQGINGFNVDISKNLAVLSITSDGDIDVTKYSYDESNRIISIKTSISLTTVDWSKFSEGMVTMNFTSDSGQLQTLFYIDQNGRAVKSITSDKSGELVKNEFSYNSQGYLRIIYDSGEKRGLSGPTITKFTYINGGLSSITVTSQTSEYDVSLSYTNGINVNTGTFNFNSLFWPDEAASYVTIIIDASIVGLLGKAIDNLPNRIGYCVCNGAEMCTDNISLSYELDNVGYLILMNSHVDEQESLISKSAFIWE